MRDLVVGLGEIGSPLLEMIKSRGISVQGYDLKNKTVIEDKYDYIHICFPYTDDFENQVKPYLKLGKVVIHSTVKPNTSKNLGVVYSPTSGVHARMLFDIGRYLKWYSGKPDSEFEKRFPLCMNVPDSTKLENTKIIVDTTYYGWLIAFRKHVDENYDVYWEFANQIQAYLGNRPIMYNDRKPIGGHCVIQNLPLLGDELFNSVIGKYSPDHNP